MSCVPPSYDESQDRELERREKEREEMDKQHTTIALQPEKSIFIVFFFLCSLFLFPPLCCFLIYPSEMENLSDCTPRIMPSPIGSGILNQPKKKQKKKQQQQTNQITTKPLIFERY